MVGGEEGGGRLLLSSSLINDFFQNSISLFFCKDFQVTTSLSLLFKQHIQQIRLYKSLKFTSRDAAAENTLQVM